MTAKRDRASDRWRLVGLDQEHWREYLDSPVHGGGPRLAAVALAQAEPNGRCNRFRRPLHAIRYEAKADEVEVVVGVGRSPALRYLISSPRSIVLEERDRAKVLRVADAVGVQTAIHLFDVSREPGSATPSLAGA